MSLRAELKRIVEQQERVLIVGLGVSGLETARFLRRIGARVVCVERADEARFMKTSKFQREVPDLRADGVEVLFGIDGEGVAKALERVSLAVVSPGVSLESAVVGALRRRGLPIVSELELGVELFDAPTIMITGSNGKSTTVSLCSYLLNASGVPAHLCGNVGIPVVADLSPENVFGAPQAQQKTLVVEASSYQLEACKRVKPRIGALLNISDNHLERHGTLQRYIEAKVHIFENQTAEDFALLNADDNSVYALRGRLSGTVVPFGTKVQLDSVPMGARVEYDPRTSQDRILLKLSGGVEVYETGNSQLLGLHNRMNIAVALIAGRLSGASAEALSRVLNDFQPLDHRLEFVGRVRGACVINDSKSTTVAATLAAVCSVAEAFPQSRLILMLGGLAKAGSWDPVMGALVTVKEHLKSVICFGKDGNLIASNCRRYGLPCQVSETLAEGTRVATDQLTDEGILLLSPGCASFDEFSDFEERGTVFRSLISQTETFIAPASRAIKH